MEKKDVFEELANNEKVFKYKIIVLIIKGSSGLV